MLYKIGRFLQVVGLGLLPVAIAGQAMDKLTLGEMLLLAVFGMIIFAIGMRLLDKPA